MPAGDAREKVQEYIIVSQLIEFPLITDIVII